MDNTKKGLLIIFTPGVLLFTSLLTFTAMRFVVGAGAIADGGIFVRVLNIILLLAGMASVLSFLPCLIIGIIILTKKS